MLPVTKKTMLEVQIIGLTPLVSNRISEENLEAQEARVTGKALGTTREAKVIEQLALASTWRIPVGDQMVFAHPTTAVFQAVIAGWAKGMSYHKKALETGFRIPKEFMLLDVGEHHIRRDYLKQGMTKGLRYRFEYTDWSAAFQVVLYEQTLSKAHFVQALQFAGERVGIGPLYLRKSFGMGRFEIVSIVS